MKYKYLIILFFLAPLLSISAQNKPLNKKNKQLAPDVCLVQAKIIKIVSKKRKKLGNSCKQSPCLATVKIIKVEKSGRTFPVKFTEGQKIEVKFSHSFKENEKLPKLKKRDYFKAQIKAKPKQNSNTYEFLIGTYQKF